MALTGWNACLKFVVLIFNLLFWLVGVGILAIAIWLRVDYANYAKVHEDLQTYYTGTYVLMAAGTIMTLVGFFGCCGACRESQCMLGSFFFLLLLIFAIEIAAGIWAYVHKPELRQMVRKKLVITVKEQYMRDKAKTEAIDLFQKEFQCCGANGYYDWEEAYLTKQEEGIEDMQFKQQDHSRSLGAGNKKNFFVPASCCKPSSKQCPPKFMISQTTVGSIYQEGCADKLEEHISDKMGIITGIVIGIMVIELLGMIFSMVLCCALRLRRFKI